MISLVAYGSSDDDSDAENEVKSSAIQSKPSPKTSTDNERKLEADAAGCSNKSEEIATGSTSKVVKNEDSERDLFSKLPPPSTNTDIFKLTGAAVPGKKPQKGPVRILIPSLSEFDDEEEPPAKKKVPPLSRGTKLTSMLPPPKGIISKERSLVPDSVKRKPTPVKPAAVRRVVPVIPPKFLKSQNVVNRNDSGDESGEDDAQTDFFSLTADHSVPTAEIPDVVEDIPYNGLTEQQSSSGQTAEYQDAYDPSNTAVEHQADSNQDFVPFNTEDLQLDDDAIQKLCGRKGRRAQEDVQIIDVSGDAIMPDSREWLTKQLTQEQPTRSHHKKDGPSTQQRRKHQITYLAFQAKENELELQSRWANNRQTRRQTQSKYGF